MDRGPRDMRDYEFMAFYFVVGIFKGNSIFYLAGSGLFMNQRSIIYAGILKSIPLHRYHSIFVIKYVFKMLSNIN